MALGQPLEGSPEAAQLAGIARAFTRRSSRASPSPSARPGSETRSSPTPHRAPSSPSSRRSTGSPSASTSRGGRSSPTWRTSQAIPRGRHRGTRERDDDDTGGACRRARVLRGVLPRPWALGRESRRTAHRRADEHLLVLERAGSRPGDRGLPPAGDRGGPRPAASSTDRLLGRPRQPRQRAPADVACRSRRCSARPSRCATGPRCTRGSAICRRSRWRCSPCWRAGRSRSWSADVRGGKASANGRPSPGR